MCNALSSHSLTCETTILWLLGKKHPNALGHCMFVFCIDKARYKSIMCLRKGVEKKIVKGGSPGHFQVDLNKRVTLNRTLINIKKEFGWKLDTFRIFDFLKIYWIIDVNRIIGFMQMSELMMSSSLDPQNLLYVECQNFHFLTDL